MTSRLFSSSTVYFLRQLLEEFHRGEIILPRFHRPLVWNTQKRLELFDSIRKGIPLGSFTIWETQAVDFPPMTEAGPFVLPKASTRKPHRYLIDGEQRLVTLYLALYGAKLRDDASLDESLEASFEIFLDLDKQVFMEDAERTPDEPFRSFPLRGLFEFRSVLRFQRELARYVKGEQLNQYIEHVDAVVQSLKECTIAVTTVVTDELELATEVFRRVNSQGVPMTTAHMLNALTSRKSSTLFDAFDEVRESLEEYPHWQYEENLSNELLLLVAKRLTGYAVDDENIKQLSAEFREPAVFERLKQSLQRTAEFFHDCGLRNPAHVPDQLMIVMLAKVFDQVSTPSQMALERLQNWVWCLTYTEGLDTANRGATYSKLEFLTTAFADGTPVGLATPRYRKTLPPFNFDTARTKAFAWMLAQRMMEFDNGEAAETLASFGEHALVTIRNRVPLWAANHCGARVLWHALKVTPLSRQVLSGNVAPHVLTAQAISSEALARLREDSPDVTGFVKLRERELNALEDERFQEIMARLFPGST